MKRFVVIATVMMMLMSCVTVAFAAGTDITQSFTDEQLEYIANNSNKFSGYLSDDATKYGANDSINTSAGTFYIVDGKDGTEISKRTEYLIRKNETAEMTTDKVSDITDGLLVEADTGAAVTMLSGFSGFINLILGFIVVVITMMMAIYTGFDVAYIAFPVFRNKCEDAKFSGNSALTKTGSNGQTKLRFVTDEAQRAVAQSASSEGGKSPWAIYFGSRVVSYVMVAIILFMFATGNINIITNLALKAVDGVMKVLQTLAF